MPTQLETLSNKFNSLLNDYKTTYNEYLGVLYRKDTSFTQVQDFSFIGENNLSTLEKSNITACEFKFIMQYTEKYVIAYLTEIIL